MWLVETNSHGNTIGYLAIFLTISARARYQKDSILFIACVFSREELVSNNYAQKNWLVSLYIIFCYDDIITIACPQQLGLIGNYVKASKCEEGMVI